ncbi:unnamed protein product, partial [marine sediment metagenome]
MTDVGFATYTLGASSTGVAAYARGEIAWEDIALNAPVVEHVPPGEDVAFRLVAGDVPSAFEMTTSLPGSIAGVPVGSTYYLELWTSDIGFLNTGVTSAYVDLSWDAAISSAMSIDHGTIYVFFTSGAIAAGFIDELGGSTFSAVGIEPEWARVAVVELTADTEGIVTYALGESSTGVSALGRGVIPWDLVSLDVVATQHFLDCNDNGIPDDQDILDGTSEDCDGNGVPDECQADSDGDGLIDVCDLCPDDPDKTDPGVCGCGAADTDSDGDG